MVTSSIDEMLARAALPAWEKRAAEMRAAFEARTGVFTPGDAFFEARSAAFWDDALTSGAFGRELAGEISEDARSLVEPLARAHRGLFRVEPHADRYRLVDAWSGAEFIAHASTTGLRDALDRAASFVDGRVVGVPRTSQIVLLPGALFHLADALEPMKALLPEARARNLGTREFLDVLMRMDHSLRTLSRVKATFAYRKEALRV